MRFPRLTFQPADITWNQVEDLKAMRAGYAAAGHTNGVQRIDGALRTLRETRSMNKVADAMELAHREFSRELRRLNREETKAMLREIGQAIGQDIRKAIARVQEILKDPQGTTGQVIATTRQQTKILLQKFISRL